MTQNTNGLARSGVGLTLAALGALAALGVMALGEASLAQGTKNQRDACTPDVFRLCSSVIPDVDRIVTCLHREKSKLSPACRSVMNGGGKDGVASARDR